MIDTASSLLAKLRLLTLAGCENGALLWIGTTEAWRSLVTEEESILREFELTKI